MGLDMYLCRKNYIGAYFEQRKVQGVVHITVNDKQLPIKFNRISEISEQLGYWRKANHIHQWFVNHVQEGQDDCNEYFVTKENMETLLDVCKQVKANHNLAPQLLPTQQGFFFGSTNYDEYYYQDIDKTIVILETILNEKDENFCYYQSSW